jgi:2,3-bisphosphoglycerate-independent phosphoglycerate mutase
MNPVPCIIISDKCKQLEQNGKLADIAPSILKLMNIQVPAEMDGNCLF